MSLVRVGRITLSIPIRYEPDSSFHPPERELSAKIGRLPNSKLEQGIPDIGLPEINRGGIEMENENNYPHGVENLPPNPHRIWVCDECDHIFADDEIRIDLASGKWAHECKCHPKRKGQRCESHLEPFIPELPSH